MTHKRDDFGLWPKAHFTISPPPHPQINSKKEQNKLGKRFLRKTPKPLQAVHLYFPSPPTNAMVASSSLIGTGVGVRKKWVTAWELTANFRRKPFPMTVDESQKKKSASEILIYTPRFF